MTRKNLDNLYSSDKEVQHQAFLSVLNETDKSVDWAYDVWDEMLANLRHKDNRIRAIAAQLLCNLAKSDPENRMVDDFAQLLAVTKDERFVTARHTLQSLWKVGAAGKSQQNVFLAGFADRFQECETEKNYTLIRYDILQGFQRLYEKVKDESIRQLALELIESEDDPKYRKKYATLWKNA